MKNLNNIHFGFLTYLSRSGSTILSRLLNEYDEICVTLEASIPPEFMGLKNYKPLKFYDANSLLRYLNNLQETTKLGTWNVDFDRALAFLKDNVWPIEGPDVLRVLLKCYRDLHKPNANFIIYKGSPLMPSEVRKTGETFSDFKIIHIIRDPRGVYNSQKKNKHPYEKISFSSSPLETSIEWEKAINVTNGIAEEYLLNIKYESLIENTNEELTNIINFLGISKNKNASYGDKFASVIPLEERSIHKNIKKLPDLKITNKWKEELTKKEILSMELYLSESLKRNGYEYICNHRGNYLLKIRLRVGWFFSFFILLLRRNRRSLKAIINDPKSYKDKIFSLFR